MREPTIHEVELQKEIDEQCRLNAMGSEREYILLGKIAQLEKERDAALVDAKRYQWLRATTNWVSSKGRRIDVRESPELWDESIDAAMEAGHERSN